MRNITNNNQLKIQETAFLDQLKINRRKLLNNKNSLFEYFKTENKQIHEKHFENSLHFFSTLRNENIIDNEKKAEGTKEFTQSLPFFRSNPKNIGKIATLVQTADKIDNIKIEKIDFRTFFKKDLKNQLLPEINLKKRKQAITDKIFLVSENKIKKELQERTKFLNIIKQKGKIPREKIKQIGTDLLLDLNNVKITNLSDSANLEDEKKHDIDKNCTLTFDEITKKLLDSKNNMARDLLILKEMKLAQDIDLTKSNLSNFRVTQKEIIINFIKRKKREYSTMNFDYNDKNLNERISKKFKKTVYLIMDKLSKMKLSVDEIFSRKIFPKRPFERPLSHEFLQSVKRNDTEGMISLLKKDRYLLYSFDFAKKTALHWAAERNFLYLMYFLINNGAEIEAKDMAGRTPLFLAVKNGNNDNIDILNLLLANGANPYAFSYGKKFASQYTENLIIKNLLKESQKFHLMRDLQPRYNRANFWKNKVEPYFLSSSLKNFLEGNIFNLTRLF